jgi:putative acetyltransferase
VLGNLTVAVSPAAQGRGIGRRLFERLLTEVRLHWPHIQRVELVTQESNQRAQRLYESLGFVREGRMERRIRSPHGGVEADIPMAWLRPTGP